MAKKKTAKKTAQRKPAKKQPAKKAAPRKPAKKQAAKKASPKPAQALQKSNSINPYLTFNGHCEEAFLLYKSVFGGKFPFVGRFKDMPPVEGKPMSAGQGEKIMHMSLPIGKESVLMGSDSSEAFGHASVMGNNFSISINAFSRKEADRIYKGLSAGGLATMPMNKTFWGSYFGMLTDKFGIQWMISAEENPNK